MTCCVVADCLVGAVDWLWAHRWTLWELTKHPVLAVGLTALVSVRWVPRIAAEYQKRAKIKEFQYLTLKDTVAQYRQLIDAAWSYFTAKAELLIAATLSLPTLETSRRADIHAESRRALDNAIKDAHVLLAMHAVLYEQATCEHWGRIVNLLTDMTTLEDPYRMGERIAQAAEQRVRFIAAVAREIPLPNSDIDLAEERLFQARREQVHELLKAIGRHRQSDPERQE